MLNPPIVQPKTPAILFATEFAPQIEAIYIPCPICRTLVQDDDGFGVVHCPACGFCKHPSTIGNLCTLCGCKLNSQISQLAHGMKAHVIQGNKWCMQLLMGGLQLVLSRPGIAVAGNWRLAVARENKSPSLAELDVIARDFQCGNNATWQPVKRSDKPKLRIYETTW